MACRPARKMTIWNPRLRQAATKIAVLPAALMNSSSRSSRVKLPSPRKSTASGLRRSPLRMSVKLITSEARTGPAMKTRNSRVNGRANPQPTAARRSRRSLRLRLCAAATSSSAAVMSGTGTDRRRLLLHRLGGVLWLLAGLDQLLQLAVDASRDLLPGGDGGRRLRVVELVAEGGQQGVALQRGVVPALLDRRQVGRRLVPLDL